MTLPAPTAHDQERQCTACGAAFVFVAAHADFFARKKWPPPSRCPACRQAARAERERMPVAAPGHKGGAGSAAARPKRGGR